MHPSLMLHKTCTPYAHVHLQLRQAEAEPEAAGKRADAECAKASAAFHQAEQLQRTVRGRDTEIGRLQGELKNAQVGCGNFLITLFYVTSKKVACIHPCPHICMRKGHIFKFSERRTRCTPSPYDSSACLCHAWYTEPITACFYPSCLLATQVYTRFQGLKQPLLIPICCLWGLLPLPLTDCHSLPPKHTAACTDPC